MDSELTEQSTSTKKTTASSPPNKFFQALILFHQHIISPADGDRSNYYPSSSQYTLNAFRRYGILKGFIMGCDRLMRENNDPWFYQTITFPNGNTFKYDPVE